VNGLTIASQIEDADTHGFLGGRRRDDNRAFRRAIRHSRFVRFVRLAIPILILLGAAGTYAAYQWLSPLRELAKLPFSVEGMVFSGSKIMMRQPYVSGFTKDKQPYTVTAKAATQDQENPHTIELQDILATVALHEQGKIELTAREGIYEGKAERLRLQKNVVVSSAEFVATLSEAVVNVRSGDVVSEQPVNVRMMQGTISANRLEIAGSGELVKFDGGVRLVIEQRTLGGDIVTGATR
jgi:lipopolysaccharide export system protein LptC